MMYTRINTKPAPKILPKPIVVFVAAPPLVLVELAVLVGGLVVGSG
jgi:hypothetical protein